tara:strand:+ start:272 stop:517 length:246 start_codon:yes stop_codon:yes gene_type:complete
VELYQQLTVLAVAVAVMLTTKILALNQQTVQTEPLEAAAVVNKVIPPSEVGVLVTQVTMVAVRTQVVVALIPLAVAAAVPL